MTGPCGMRDVRQAEVGGRARGVGAARVHAHNQGGVNCAALADARGLPWFQISRHPGLQVCGCSVRVTAHYHSVRGLRSEDARLKQKGHGRVRVEGGTPLDLWMNLMCGLTLACVLCAGHSRGAINHMVR